MAIIVTPSRRRIAMAIILVLAVAGSVIRHQAPDPSAWRDVGTLLLVMWLPAVGNLVAFLVSKLPRRRRPPVAFDAGAPFVAHLQTTITPADLPVGWLATLDASERRCTLVVGQRGYTVRSDAPVAEWLTAAPHTLALQCLVPSVALHDLRAGTAFDLLAGSTLLARGIVC